MQNHSPFKNLRCLRCGAEDKVVVCLNDLTPSCDSCQVKLTKEFVDEQLEKWHNLFIWIGKQNH